MKENILLEKSFAFAVRVINAYKYLIAENCDFAICRPFLQSGTEIGSHVEEAAGGGSKGDFLFEMTNAYKKARKTKYWIVLLQTAGYFDQAKADSLLNDLEEILRIIAKSQLTTKKSLPDS